MTVELTTQMIAADAGGADIAARCLQAGGLVAFEDRGSAPRRRASMASIRPLIGYLAGELGHRRGARGCLRQKTFGAAWLSGRLLSLECRLGLNCPGWLGHVLRLA